MDCKVRNMETIKLPRLGVNIRGWGWPAMVMLSVYGWGTLFSTIIWICLGYRVLRLLMRLFGLLLSVIFTLASILFWLLIISLVII